MEPDDAGLSELIVSIHEAGAGFGSWAGVADAAVRLFGGVSASIMVTGMAADMAAGAEPAPEEAPELLAMPGYSATALRLYAEHFHRVDLWAALGRLRPSMRAVLGSEHVGEAAFERSEVWNDYSRLHVGAFHLVGAAIPLEGGGVGLIGLHRPRDAAAFDPGDRARLQRLLPHLRSGLGLRRRLVGVERAARAAEDALHLLDFGVAIVDAAGAPVFVNAEAARIAAARDVVLLRGRALEAADPEAARRLRGLVRDAAGGGAGGAMALGRAGSGAPVLVRVSPLAPSLAAAVRREGAGLAMIALSDLDRRPETPAAILRQTFGLTAAEARLATELLEGRSLAEIAAARAVAISTLRFQLSAVLAKTGTRRQGDLLRLLGRLPQVAGPAAPG